MKNYKKFVVRFLGFDSPPIGADFMRDIRFKNPQLAETQSSKNQKPKIPLHPIVRKKFPETWIWTFVQRFEKNLVSKNFASFQ